MTHPLFANADVSAVDFAATRWNVLRLLNVFRLGIGLSLIGFSVFVPDAVGLGRFQPRLFAFVLWIYLAFSLGVALALWLRKPSLSRHAFVPFGVDVIAITLIMYASGGFDSGLAILLVATATAAGLLLSQRQALTVAAAAALAVLTQQFYFDLNRGTFSANYVQAGLLGGTFFAMAALAGALARRARESEALASQRGVDLANMAQLNEYIIQRIESGILVIDAHDRIRLMNEAAWHLLGMPTQNETHALQKLSPELFGQLAAWRRSPDYEPETFRVPTVVSKILPRFARLGHRENAGTLIYLEDSAVMTQRAQDLKLTSLGRLTASIAHEIRNPLGAISHAAQLLAESPNLHPAEQRLTRIVLEQSARMNTIIENIMQLSRRDRTRPEIFRLKPWLEGFVEEFARTQGIEAAQIDVAIEPSGVEVWMDPSHLHQVLFNLCQNGLRHGARHPRNPKLMLRGGVTIESRGPFLDVIDFGPGVDPDVAQHIFEPFFTTEPQGTGLGLYIARELCESNQAHVEYVPTPTGGSCFRITFVDPKRRGA